MTINPVEFKLKDGRVAILKSPENEDIPGILDYLYTSAGETDFILRYPEECTRYTPEKEKELIDQMNRSEEEAMIICVVDGFESLVNSRKVAGNCSIHWKNRIKTKHRASIGIALIKEFWNLGIGTRMFEEMTRIAVSNPDLLQLELEYVEGNSRARALYEKMGFRIAGVRPDAIRLKDGTILNEYLMMKKL